MEAVNAVGNSKLTPELKIGIRKLTHLGISVKITAQTPCLVSCVGNSSQNGRFENNGYFCFS